MKHLKRPVAWLLALCMILSVLPVSVFATSSDGKTEYIMLGSDRHGETDVIGALLTRMEEEVGDNAIDYVGLLGDMVNSTNSYSTQTLLNEVQSAASNLTAQDVDVIYAAHDEGDVTDDLGMLNKTSGHWYTGDNFYIYGVIQNDVSSTSNAQTAATNFTTWVNGLSATDERVIIVISHFPIHAKRGDNKGANYWHTALNAAAGATVDDDGTITVERNIMFFHGHNHTNDSEEYFYEVGDSMEVEGSSNSSDTIYYTYATAGYMLTNRNTGAQGGNGHATLLAIGPDTVTLSRYHYEDGLLTSTDDYAYDTDGYAEVSRAVTEEEATLTGITVSGQESYYAGDAFVAPTVTAVYSDTTKNTVLTAEEYEVSGTYDMNTAGTYTLTYTYEDYSAAYTFEVKSVYIESIAVTTKPTKLSYVTGEELDTAGMVVTATYNNGTTAVVTPTSVTTPDMSTAGTKTVTVNYVDVVTFKTTFTITVEEGIAEDITLESIAVAKSPTKTEYLMGEALDIDGLVVKATFSDGSTVELSYKPFSTSAVYGGYELGNYSMYVEKNHAIEVTYTYGGVTKTATFTINVWNKELTDVDTDVTVSVASGDYGVTAVNVAESSNAYVPEAVADVISGTNYKAYDITLSLDADTTEDGEAVYALTNGNKTVTLPIPEGVTNPVVYYVSDDGKTVTNMNAVNNDDGTVTFTTTHFSTYVVGDGTVIELESGNATTDGTEDVTTTTKVAEEVTVYKLVANPESGKTYLIVNSNSGTGYGLDGDTAGYATTVFTGGDGYYSTWDDSAKTGTAFAAGSDVYLTTADSEAYLWTAGDSSFTIGYSSDGYGLTSDITYTLNPASSTAGSWTLNSNKLSISLLVREGGFWADDSYTTYYLTNSGATWSMSTSGSNVYFYEPVTIYKVTEQETTIPGTVGHTYSTVGTDITDAAAIANRTVTLSSVLYDTPDGGTATDITASSGLTPTYEVVTTKGNPNVISSINGSTAILSGVVGTAVVKVTYTSGDLVAWDEFVVTTTAPDHYSIELHKAELTVAAVTADTFAKGVYYTFNTVTNTYEVADSYVDGTTYYTAFVAAEGVTAENFAAGVYYTYDSATKTYAVAKAYAENTTYYTYAMKPGDAITTPLALKGIEAGDTYTVWAVVKAYASESDTEGTDIGTLGDALNWAVSDTSIATIDAETGLITFTGTNYGTFEVTVSYKGADGKVITDTIIISVTESLYVVPGDGTNDFPEYPNEGAVRFDKTATAVGNFSESGIALVELSMTGVPYSTGNAIDALLVLDMSTSMKTSVGTDDDGNSVTRYDVTAAATKAFVKTIVQNDDGTYNNNTVAIQYFNGTTAYTLTDYITISSDTELEALNGKIDALMADPPSTSGTDYSTSMKTAYDTIIARDAVSDNTQALVFMSDGGPTYYTYVNGDSYGTVSNNASTIVGWFDTNNNGTSDDGTDDTATPNSSFKNEYYSTLLKNAGYPVYTVGLGLSSNKTGPDAFTNLTSGAHEAITSYILSSMATNSSYFYNVADEDAVANMGNIFSGIAASIKEAATDVVIEDKIGNNYSINFSVPGFGTDNAASEEALDGITEFYIQVVDYILDSTTHERTGVYTVLENFTFNADGTLKSHTVDGEACGDTCTHVTTTDGVITAINGTYFDYKSDSTGEYLTWEAEKLTSTELALQYFAHLDDSSGVAEAEQIDPGTYYTNEYATLTYTNVNNKVVQNKFPVPQMTWYGAQVSYVFYLVNEAGEPVNRAGRVVPFAEAVYVTDVNTYAIVWNDLEQSASLDANYLAESLVPSVYALYDDDASYNIHVYANAEGANLNNHFVIGGDVTDDYNTVTNSWTNAKTTYVFNTKSDGTKYNVVGAYIPNDGKDATDSKTYKCKSAYLENATYTTSVDDAGVTVYTVTSVGEGYQKVDGETQVLASALESTTGGTIIGDYIYYVDENGVYTIVQKTDGTEVRSGFDFANTTVAFAVVWKPELVADTVVIDFGLDVVIDVTTNDNMASGVVGVRTAAPEGVSSDGTYTRDQDSTQTSVDVYIDQDDDVPIGTATVENLTSVRFSLNKASGMQFDTPVTFYYESDVNYYKNDVLQTTSMYSSVTVIPATTVYYEESFVTFTDSTASTGTLGAWTVEGNDVGGTQATDRPGFDAISEAYDANNPYGYDSHYTAFTQYSNGGAMKVTVDATTGSASTAPTATFTFTGTGFDIISVTDNTSGCILVTVSKLTDGTSTTVKTLTVNNYYGYSYGEYTDEDGNTQNGWYVNEKSEGSVWQVPVIKVSGLDHGTYKVEIKVVYLSVFDIAGKGSYSFVLDAIRIYDPAKGNDEAEEAYAKDKEYGPQYMTLRNLLVNADTLGTGANNQVGVVFIDGIDKVYDVDTYANPGPNNETYLAQNQLVAFKLQVAPSETYASQAAMMEDLQIMLGVKLAFGEKAKLSVTSGTKAAVEMVEVATATDMYYDLGQLLTFTKQSDGTWLSDVITLSNTGDAGNVISITNLKYSHTNAGITVTPVVDQNETETAGVYTLSRTVNSTVDTMSVNTLSTTADTTVEEETETVVPFALTAIVDAETVAVAQSVCEDLFADPVVEEPEEVVPETTEPEETEPEETVPETTEPEETEPEEVVPETTEPEETEPEETVPEETQPEETEPEEVEPFVPGYLTMKWESGKRGRTSTLTITTSADVESVTVNGEEIRYYQVKMERENVGHGRGRGEKVEYRVWTYTVRDAEESAHYEVVVYDENGTASVAIDTVLTTDTHKGPVEWIWDLIKKLFG